MVGSASDLDVYLEGPAGPAPCGMCGAFSAANQRVVVSRPEQRESPVAETAACGVCLEHYGGDGIASRLWPDICDWVPSKVLDECHCETCTGQIEFRFNAGTDFYE
ncbi:MAG TPA: hypothetical protein VNN10_12380 [Dehalococcoidia bacterium]|nr:hypothetical protein [Dehalococcoidia bacterium]